MRKQIRRNIAQETDLTTYIEPSEMTLEKFLESWLDAVCEPSLSPTTVKRYRSIVKYHINPHLGSVPVNKLTPLQIQGLYSLKLKEGQSNRSVQQLHAILHRALFQAMRWEYCQRNVADLVQAPRPRKKEMKVLNIEQVKKFLETAKEDWYYPLFVLALTTGLRLGELLGLRWEDIDLQEGLLRVRRSLKEVNGQLLIGDVKTPSSRRTVALPQYSIEVLKKHQEALKEKGINSEEWVFPNRAGNLSNPPNMTSRHFKPLLKKAGVPSIRFHDLRHTHATLLLMQEVNPKLVQERLGHSSITLTLDTYSHVLPNMQKYVAKQLDDIFDNETQGK